LQLTGLVKAILIAGLQEIPAKHLKTIGLDDVKAEEEQDAKPVAQTLGKRLTSMTFCLIQKILG
jgi:hypothetical protein